MTCIFKLIYYSDCIWAPNSFEPFIPFWWFNLSNCNGATTEYFLLEGKLGDSLKCWFISSMFSTGGSSLLSFYLWSGVSYSQSNSLTPLESFFGFSALLYLLLKGFTSDPDLVSFSYLESGPISIGNFSSKTSCSSMIISGISNLFRWLELLKVPLDRRF